MTTGLIALAGIAFGVLFHDALLLGAGCAYVFLDSVMEDWL